MQRDLSLTVLGAGIKGSAIAALASIAGFRVRIIDANGIAAGTTSTNHGRLHAGTASWKTDSIELMKHRWNASQLLAEVLSISQNSKTAVYAFASQEEAQAFQQKTELAAIPLNPVSPRDVQGWVGSRPISNAYEIEEFAFDPAQTAASMCGLALANGGEFIKGRAVSIENAAYGLKTAVEGGGVIESDFVVNALSAWTNEIELPEEFPRIDVSWYFWSLICAKSEMVDQPLDRVVVFWPKGGSAKSAIPHGAWITLDDAATRVHRSKTASLTVPWRPWSVEIEDDRALLSSISSGLDPVPSVASDGFFILTGLHARREEAAPGSTNSIEHYKGRYFVSFGGQATTSLQDAVGALEVIFSKGMGRSFDTEAQLGRLAAELRLGDPISDARMRWNW